MTARRRSFPEDRSARQGGYLSSLGLAPPLRSRCKALG
jgi:hypothetical protein